MRNANEIISIASVRVHSNAFSHLPAMLAMAAALLGTAALTAQSSRNLQSTSKASAHSHRKSGSRNARTLVTQPAPPPEAVAPTQPAPEMPHWPVNSDPAQPAVTWDSHGLRIDAANASLHQILDQVASATGAKVEGLGTDERVFGEYGPGEARDVLSQLLHGSGYNVLLIGDQGQGTPREIVLSARRPGSSNQNAARQPVSIQEPQEDEVVEQPEIQEPPPSIPQPPRTPQQVMQELLQRQQQMNQPLLNPPQPPK